MFFFLLPISIVLLILLIHFNQEKSLIKTPYKSLRRSFLISLLVHSLIIFLFNELLSVYNGLNITNAKLFWTGLVVLEISLLYRSYQKNLIQHHLIVSMWKPWKDMGATDKVLISGVILLYLLPLLFLSATVPPNNFDAHSYHLTRIIEWLGNQNINHYPTRHNQQLYHNVFAEYMVMHTFLLSESDTFSGMVQFMASLGSIAACSLVTHQLGGSLRVQILSAIMLITLPIAVLESTSVQVDYIACFFFISFLYFGYEAIQDPKSNSLLAMAVSLAFGAFSKYTIFMFSLPFCLYFGIQFFRKRGLLGSTRIFVFFIVALFVVFAPFMFRNYELFGNILSPVEGSGIEAEKLSVGEISFRNTISGVVKNIGLHIGLPFNGYNLYMERLVEQVHQLLLVNINPVGMDLFSVRFVLHEDMAPNTIHLALLAVSLLGLIFVKGHGRLKWFAFCACMGLAIFSTLMVFQLWSSRTHMPFFAMGCIISAIILDHFLNKKAGYVALLLIITSLAFVFSNPSKPLLPLRYYSKKLLDYTPTAICPQNAQQSLAVTKLLARYYSSTPNASNCYILEKPVDRKDQAKIFKILDSVGYYNDEKYETVFALNKSQVYFLNHIDNYTKFNDLIVRMKGLNENVGVLFQEGNGYYHYWATVQSETYKFGQMKYIGYRPRYSALANAKTKFEYRYILGDTAKLLAPYYKKNMVDTVYYSKGFYLAKLKTKVADITHL
jgi:hypothetical protein